MVEAVNNVVDLAVDLVFGPSVAEAHAMAAAVEHAQNERGDERGDSVAQQRAAGQARANGQGGSPGSTQAASAQGAAAPAHGPAAHPPAQPGPAGPSPHANVQPGLPPDVAPGAAAVGDAHGGRAGALAPGALDAAADQVAREGTPLSVLRSPPAPDRSLALLPFGTPQLAPPDLSVGRAAALADQTPAPSSAALEVMPPAALAADQARAAMTDPARTPPPAAERILTEALVARRSAAIAAAFRVGGELDGARELRALTRDVPPAVAGEIVVASRATVERIIVAAHRQPDGPGGDRVGAVERVQAGHIPALAPRHSQMAADIAGTFAHVARNPAGEGLAQDAARLILEVESGADYRLSSYSLGIPFGTGVTLPLAIAEQLGQRGDRRRQRQLLLAVEQGLHQLGARVAAAVDAVLAVTRPLADEFAAAGEAAEAGLSERADVLAAFSGAMARLDAAGGEVLLALDTLSRRMPPELGGVRAALLADVRTAFAVAQSPSAQEVVIARSTAGDGALRVERVQAVFRGLGFGRSRAGLLATATWRTAVLMQAGWMKDRAMPGLDESARAFEALLRFMGAAPRAALRPVVMADVDAAAEAPVGLDLFGALEAVEPLEDVSQ